MCRVDINAGQIKVSIDAATDEANNRLAVKVDLEPMQDFIGCLLTGLLAAMPYFLEAFLKCLGGEGTPGKYNPGNRSRCGT